MGAGSTETLPDRGSYPRTRAGSPADDPGLGEARVARRLVLHLARQPRLGPDDIAPPTMTQAGMAEALGVTQGAVAKIVIRLSAAGVIRTAREHVQGAPRRLKVYTLTGPGEMLAHELRVRATGIPGTGSSDRGVAPSSA